MSDIIRGFQPVFDARSKLLILGSFPSVKSRAVSFYYGNRQNRFWKTLSDFFGEKIGDTAEEKQRFVLSHRIALWDIVTECEIDGSSDASIRNYRIADLKEVLDHAKVEYIFLNGKKALEIFVSVYGDIAVPFRLLPSTSPANPRFSESAWFDALSQFFGSDV